MLESWYYVINLHLHFDVLPAAVAAAVVVLVAVVAEAVAVVEFFVFGFAFGFFNVFMVEFSFPLRLNILINTRYL